MSDDTKSPTDTAAQGTGNGESDRKPVIDRGNRKKLFVILAVVVAVIAVGWVLYDVFIGSRTVSTDNAYVDGQNADVTPLVSGQIVAVSVTNTQIVKKGQLLLQIDNADQKLAVQKAEADLAAARRMFEQTAAQGRSLGAQAAAQGAAIGEARASLVAARTDLAKAQADYDRRKALQGTGAVSADELTSALAALQASRAKVQQMSATLARQESERAGAEQAQAATEALVRGTSVDTAPAVMQAKAALDQARLNLARTEVRAPVDGVVSKLTAQVGQMAQQGMTTMTIVPVDQLYVDANFKENKLGKVRVGQEVTLTSDFYGSDVEYHGRVVGLAGGTGAAFAPIPAQNASGNWIKVVQRLPVRIALDPKELRQHPLRVGLSMNVSIDVVGAR